MSALEEGLKKIHRAAKKKEASVHLPRIGHATKGFNWYGTERLVRKHLSSRGIPTSIYYYSSRAASSRPSAVAASASPTSRGGAVSQAAGSSAGAGTSGGGAARSADSSGPVLASFMSGVHIFFYNLAASERKRLARYLITYDGDEEELMSADVTHIVAEVESPVHTQELKDLLHGCPQALPVQKAWLEACFSKQRKVNTANYLIGLH